MTSPSARRHVFNLPDVATRRDVLAQFATPTLAALGASAFLSGCDAFDPRRRATIRYAVVVEVEEYGRVHSGRVVREISYALPGSASLTGHVNVKLHGEAVAIDLGGRGTLFALMRGDIRGVQGGVSGSAEYVVARVYLNSSVGDLNEERLRTLKALVGQSRELARDRYPMFVRFRNLADPRTVERVDPDDLAASFRHGVRLRRVVLQIVAANDPVTADIHKRLAWLKPNPEPRLVPEEPGEQGKLISELPLHRQLFHRDFRSK